LAQASAPLQGTRRARPSTPMGYNASAASSGGQGALRQAPEHRQPPVESSAPPETLGNERGGRGEGDGRTHRKLGGRGRGWHPRHVAETAHDPEDWSLGRYATYVAKVPHQLEEERYAARDKTARRVLLDLRSGPEADLDFEDQAPYIVKEVLTASRRPPAIEAQFAKARLFVDTTSPPAPSGDPSTSNSLQDGASDNVMYLLGKSECMAIPARADFGANFEPIFGAKTDCDGANGFRGWFYVLHMGAPNIGEGEQAEDFMAYAKATRSSAPRLDEERYLEDIRRIWKNAILAMASLGVDDGVLFPIGMGAFLRNLKFQDEAYRDYDKMRNLRRKIADQLMSVLVELYGDQKAAPPTSVTPGDRKAVPGGARGSRLPKQIHLCLAVVDGPGQGETVHNHNVFVEAGYDVLESFPSLPSILKFHRNQDLLQITHELAEKATSPLKVAALNGANRKLFGNHWFSTGASLAIDENLHRRSASLARAALLLNQSIVPKERRKTELIETVEALGGKVVDLHKGETSPSKLGSSTGGAKASSGARGGGLIGRWFGCLKKSDAKTAKRRPEQAKAGAPAPAGKAKASSR